METPGYGVFYPVPRGVYPAGYGVRGIKKSGRGTGYGVQKKQMAGVRGICPGYGVKNPVPRTLQELSPVDFTNMTSAQNRRFVAFGSTISYPHHHF